MTGPIPTAVALRAATRYVIDPLGCWVSTYSLGSHGYAQVGWQAHGEKVQMTTAHRAAWTHHFGPIPPGLTVDHLCRKRPCVRPDHLRLLTNEDNASDNGGPTRRTAPPAGRDCPRCGTPMVLAGARAQVRCRPCTNRYARAYKARLRAAARQT